MKRLVIVVNAGTIDLNADLNLAVSHRDDQIEINVGGGTIDSPEALIAHLENNIPTGNMTVNGSIALISGAVGTRNSHVLIGTVGGEVSSSVATFLSIDNSLMLSDDDLFNATVNNFASITKSPKFIIASPQ